MLDILLHVYRKGSRPFRTLSALTDQQAVQTMEGLYVAGSIFWERFAQPADYLRRRRQVERALRAAFIEKGGSPTDDFPIYMILGRPEWFDTAADPSTLETTAVIEVPLSVIPPGEVSFTYPDSMASAATAADIDPAYFESNHHGRIFSLAEITEVVDAKGLPGTRGQTATPNQPPPYIEAQVWNQRVLDDYLSSIGHYDQQT
jgi:uncharacterized protein YbjT (DUF2867 family)